MSSRQGRECGPGLSAWWNVLPLFFANYALPRRDTARRVLGAAGSANERFHITVPGTRALCTLIIDRPRPTSLGFTSRKTRNGVSATPRNEEFSRRLRTGRMSLERSLMHGVAPQMCGQVASPLAASTCLFSANFRPRCVRRRQNILWPRGAGALLMDPRSKADEQ